MSNYTGLQNRRTHGYYITHRSEYQIWTGMIARCYNKQNKSYRNYGEKGVIICERWLNSFDNFITDMGLRPSNKHSIDRFPDKAGNYEIGNCRWATTAQQNRNYTRNIFIEHNGQVKCLIEWCELLNLNYGRVVQRIKKLKWPIERAFSV